jgi:PAS domain S-box-containing protein
MERDEASDSQTAPEVEDVSSLDRLPLHSTDLLTLLDETGVVLYESPSIEWLYGYEQDALVGEQVAEYFHPEDRERVVAAFTAIVSRDDHHVETVEYRHEQADGSYKWIESVGSSNPTPDGNYVINSRDISERKQRERELHRTREQVQSERDGKEAIRQLLLETSTDQDIVDTACRLLVESYGCEAAWVVWQETDSEETHAALTAARYGSDRGLLDGEKSFQSEYDPATRQTLEDGSPSTITTDTDQPFADRLADCDCQSIRSVPIAHEGLSFGALTVLRSEAAADVSRELVAEFAEAIAFKQRVRRQQATLAADTVIELEIGITAGHFLLALSSAVSPATDAPLFAHQLPGGDEKQITYLIKSRDVDAESLEAAAGGVESIREVTRIADGDEMGVLRIRVDPPALGTVVSQYGGAVESIVVRDGMLELTLQCPRLTDVGEVVGAIQEHWPEATVRSRRDRAPEDGPPTRFESLTDKQEEALRAATVAGFFERPQQANATDVADSLGISRSTFLHHLRNAERAVFEDAFDVGPDAE